MGIRRLGRAIRLCIIVYLASLAGVAAVTYGWPEGTTVEPADTIVCLGAGAREGRLTRRSYERALTCADLYLEASTAPRIAFSGIVAGPLMAEVALARGVPAEAIVVEGESRSTLQNALFTTQMVPVDNRIVVVTDAFHLPRSWVAFRVMGYTDISLVASEMPRLRPIPLLRETLAIWFNAGRIVLWWATPWLPEPPRAALLA